MKRNKKKNFFKKALFLPFFWAIGNIKSHESIWQWLHVMLINKTDVIWSCTFWGDSLKSTKRNIVKSNSNKTAAEFHNFLSLLTVMTMSCLPTLGWRTEYSERLYANEISLKGEKIITQLKKSSTKKCVIQPKAST